MTDSETPRPEDAAKEETATGEPAKTEGAPSSGAVAVAPTGEAQPASSAEPAAAAEPVAVPEGEAAAKVEGAEGEEEDKPVPYELVLSEMKANATLHLQFKVEAEQYDAKTKEIYDDLQKETVIDGFRKGKAPRNLIKARYHRAVQNDAIEAIQRNVLAQYAKKESPDVLTEPVFEEIKEIKEGEPLTINVSMEVRPKLEKVEYGDLAVEVESREVADKDVDEELEHLRQSHASYVAEDNGVITPESGLTIDILVKDDRGREVPQMSRPDFRVINFGEHLPKAICEALIGKKVGETVEAALEHKRENRAGAVLSEKDHYAITIKEVQRRELPALEDEFAKDCGEYETLDALKADIRKRLKEAEDNRRRSESVRKICEKLLECNPFDAPPSLTASSTYRLMQESYYNSMMIGDDPRHWSEERREATAAAHAESAVAITKNVILIGEIGRIEKIEVADADLDKEIERLAEEQGRRPLAVRAQLEKQKRLDTVREGLKIRKVQDFLVGKAHVTYKPAEEKPANEKAAEAKPAEEGTAAPPE